MGILDDHELLLDSMISWIAEHAPEFEVVVRAERWVDLVRSENFPTALVLMDFQLVEPVSVEASSFAPVAPRGRRHRDERARPG